MAGLGLGLLRACHRHRLLRHREAGGKRAGFGFDAIEQLARDLVFLEQHAVARGVVGCAPRFGRGGTLSGFGLLEHGGGALDRGGVLRPAR